MNKAHKSLLADAALAIETAKGTIESVLEDETNAFEELSERSQEGPKGEAMQENIAELENVIDQLGDVLNALEQVRGT